MGGAFFFYSHDLPLIRSRFGRGAVAGRDDSGAVEAATPWKRESRARTRELAEKRLAAGLSRLTGVEIGKKLESLSYFKIVVGGRSVARMTPLMEGFGILW
jgi:hypothetical protein